jgi:hypothetical protein
MYPQYPSVSDLFSSLAVPHRSRRAAVNLLETNAAHCSHLVAARLHAVPHRSLLATGSLLVASLVPPESTWVVRLQAATLQARPATVNPATSRSRGPIRRSRTRTLRPGPLGWSQECRRWSRKLKEIVVLNHVS